MDIKETAKHGRLIIYGEYFQFIESVKYYQLEQMYLRFKVSKILMGTFAVIGAFFFFEVHINHFRPLIACTIIPFFAALLIITIMREYLIVKERLRLSDFICSKSLEGRFHWLPKFHTKMQNPGTKTFHGSVDRKANYYLGCIFILYIVSMISLILNINVHLLANQSGKLILLICTFAFYFLASWITYYLIIKSVKTTQSFVDAIEEKFGNRTDEDLIKDIMEKYGRRTK